MRTLGFSEGVATIDHEPVILAESGSYIANFLYEKSEAEELADEPDCVQDKGGDLHGAIIGQTDCPLCTDVRISGLRFEVFS